VNERKGWLALTAAIVIFDQVTKVLVAARMELHESRLLLDGFLSFTYVRNHGGAFGALSDADLPYQAALFSLVSLIALFAIVVYWWRTPLDNRWAQGGLALIVGGAIGNLIDRARLGYVIDFVDAYWGSHHWPAFNVADSAITVGVCMLLLDVLRDSQQGAPQAAPAGRNR
jgi:signal peptidase II